MSAGVRMTAPGSAPLLEVEDLTMRFGMVTAAEGETVTLSPGEFVGIVGPNGAGKTTFLNLVTGYLRPQRGRIRFQGRDITGMRPAEIVTLGIGRSFQIPQLFLSLTVLENVLVALAAAEGRTLRPGDPLHRPERARAGLEVLQRFALADDAERPASALPEGGRKLLDIAMAFALRPRLLLMDEPTSGVSAEEKFVVMDTLVPVLRAAGVTAVFVEHDLEVVRRYAGRVLVLDAGRIVADGPPDAVLAPRSEA